eukprot:UN31430
MNTLTSLWGKLCIVENIVPKLQRKKMIYFHIFIDQIHLFVTNIDIWTEILTVK